MKKFPDYKHQNDLVVARELSAHGQIDMLETLNRCHGQLRLVLVRADATTFHAVYQKHDPFPRHVRPAPHKAPDARCLSGNCCQLQVARPNAAV